MTGRRTTQLEPPLEARIATLAMRVVLVLLALSVTALGCGGSGDLPLDQVDPNAAPAAPTYDQVFAILHNDCTNCHAGGDGGGFVVSRARTTTSNATPDLSNCVEIVAFAGDIFDQVANDRMPPGAMPRLTSAEKLLIQRWVENGAPAPCN